mmetsp:Transcript_17225/g.44040  ORF Transcript_17225/g.44040 Transcript_17225/m.44040 type:complete len:303 (+) Transcript_17225:83-991(+)
MRSRRHSRSRASRRRRRRRRSRNRLARTLQSFHSSLSRVSRRLRLMRRRRSLLSCASRPCRCRSLLRRSWRHGWRGARCRLARNRARGLCACCVHPHRGTYVQLIVRRVICKREPGCDARRLQRRCAERVQGSRAAHRSRTRDERRARRRISLVATLAVVLRALALARTQQPCARRQLRCGAAKQHVLECHEELPNRHGCGDWCSGGPHRCRRLRHSRAVCCTSTCDRLAHRRRLRRSRCRSGLRRLLQRSSASTTTRSLLRGCVRRRVRRRHGRLVGATTTRSTSCRTAKAGCRRRPTRQR